jgi:hypothetical protein
MDHQQMPWFHRPWGEMILEKTRRGDIVVCHSPEVVFYGPRNVHVSLRILDEKGVSLVWVHCDYDLKTPEGRRIRQRRVCGAANHRARAEWCGDIPAARIGWHRTGRTIRPDIPVRLLAELITHLHDQGLNYDAIAAMLARFSTRSSVMGLVYAERHDWPKASSEMLPVPRRRGLRPGPKPFQETVFGKTRDLLRTGWFSCGEMAKHVGLTYKQMQGYISGQQRGHMRFFLIKDSMTYTRTKFTWCDDQVEQQLLAARPLGPEAMRRIVTPIPDVADGAVAPPGRTCRLPELPPLRAGFQKGRDAPNRYRAAFFASHRRARLQSLTSATANDADTPSV